MKKKKQEHGQIFMLLVVSIIGLLAIVGLGVDSARIFIEKRRVQNAVDNAAMAGALALCANGTYDGDAAKASAESVMTSYGYSKETISEVGYNVRTGDEPGEPINLPSGAESKYAMVATLTSQINPILIQIIYTGDVAASARGVSYCKLAQATVFNHAAYALGNYDTCGTYTLSITGANADIEGGLHSNSSAKVNAGGGGNGATVEGPVGSVGGIDDNGTTYEPAGNAPVIVDEQDPAMPYRIGDFRPSSGNVDLAANTITLNDVTYPYYDMSAYKTGITVKGSAMTAQGHVDAFGNLVHEAVYYSDDSFTLNIAMVGKATFVAEKQITFSGDSALLYPLVDEILTAFAQGGSCSTPGFTVSGSGVRLNGFFFAPNGNAKVSGSTFVLNGLLVALTVDVQGSDSTIIYNPIYEPPPPPTVGIIE